MFFFASDYTAGVLYSCPLLRRVFSLMVGVVIASNRSISSIRSPRVTDTSFVFVSYLLYRLYSTESSQFFSPDITVIWAGETKSFCRPLLSIGSQRFCPLAQHQLSLVYFLLVVCLPVSS